MNGRCFRVSLLALTLVAILALATPGCRRQTTSQPVVVQLPPAEETRTPEPGVPGTLEDVDLELVPYLEGLEQPVLLTHAGDGSGRSFVVERTGYVRVVRNGELSPTPFLDISASVSTNSERGLLGLAFPPAYAQNGRFYVNYTDRDGTTTISRFSASSTDPDLAAPDSEQVLLRIEQPHANHNGGHLAFGPDGQLFIGMGDGGSGGDPLRAGQDPYTLLGKMLRIDVGESGQPARGEPYGIPEDNPWANPDSEEDPLPELWALGLRNPWRFSFDRETDDLWIGDVGQNAWEEIDFEPAGSPGGLNFGWNVLEGTHPYPPDSDPGDTSRFTMPVVEYDRAAGQSVTGGYVYRGEDHPGLTGVYLYADFSTGRIWGLAPDNTEWKNRLLLESGLQVVSFGEDEDGEIYVVDFAGSVLKVTDR
ncbi:MAG: PQQ-dependent sugar dehydrogenase [Coriobacteriia bacterium]|nr:PQQ-dependent sugar dehydrogenase [Coriobacteriia bacterium]